MGSIAELGPEIGPETAPDPIACPKDTLVLELELGMFILTGECAAPSVGISLTAPPAGLLLTAEFLDMPDPDCLSMGLASCRLEEAFGPEGTPAVAAAVAVDTALVSRLRLLLTFPPSAVPFRPIISKSRWACEIR